MRPAPRPRAAYLYLQTATAAATVLLVLVISADALLRFQLGSTVLRSPSERAPVAVMLGEATAIPTPEHTSVAQAEELRALGAPQEPPVGSQPTPAVAGDASTAPGASPQPQTMLVAGQPSETGNAGATEASEVQATGEPEGAPSRTFAKSAAAPPTTPTEGPAIPSAVAAGEESPLPLPDVEPTAMLPAADTPLSPAATSAAEIPPTATSAPEIAPTATSTPPAEISEPAAVAMPPTSGAAPSAQPGAWLRDEPGAQPPESYGGPLAILESARPALRWARFVLIPLVAVLVAVTLWARRRLQSA